MHGGARKKLKAAAAAMFQRVERSDNAIAQAFAAAAANQEIKLWEENLRSFELFRKVSTQWRTGGAGGVIGLDYGAIYPLLERVAESKDDWLALFEDLQTMEAGALEAMRPD